MKDAILSHFSGNFLPFYQHYIPTEIKKTGGSQWMALCPFHKDSDPSLGIDDTTGKYFCHGCQKGGDIFHFYGKTHGLNTKSDFSKILNGIGADFGIEKPDAVKQKITGVYEYKDLDGKLVYQSVRKEPGKFGKKKDFYQRAPGKNGAWIHKVQSIPKILYNLAAVAEAEQVLIVEGEKDCDNLGKLGIVATTNVGGAGKWLDCYNETLKGKDIVLIPDNDKPGRNHMAKVAQSLNGTCRSLKYLVIDGLENKGDVTDFFKAVGNKKDAIDLLARMIEICKPYSPPKKPTFADACLDISAFRLIQVGLRCEYLSPWLKEASMGLISGARGTGKTFFAMGILNAITSGQSFGPWDCCRPASVLFVDGEMPAADIQERIDLLGIGDVRKKPFEIYSDAYANSMGLPRANLYSERWRDLIKGHLIQRKIDLWVIDNLASVAGGHDENSRQEWDPINQWLIELRFLGVATIMLHHTNKTGGQRGTSAREDNLDYSVVLKNPADYVAEDGARFICHFSKARVGTAGLNLVQDIEFKFAVDETGEHVWTCGSVRQAIEIDVLNLLHDGVKQIEISKGLGIHRGQVTKIKQRALKNGWMNNEMKLLKKGYEFIQNGQE